MGNSIMASKTPDVHDYCVAFFDPYDFDPYNIRCKKYDDPDHKHNKCNICDKIVVCNENEDCDNKNCLDCCQHSMKCLRCSKTSYIRCHDTTLNLCSGCKIIVKNNTGSCVCCKQESKKRNKANMCPHCSHTAKFLKEIKSFHHLS